MRLAKEERMTELKNQILFGKYRIIKPLGSGSFSEVLLVEHLSLEQERAIKIIPHSSESSFSPIMEAMLLNSLNHPGIPQIYDVEQDELNYYLVEEYIQGESLDKFLLNQQKISPGFFYKICNQLCNIFTYLHSFTPFPIIYGDLKPEHIIVCGDKIKLIDYGISTIVSNTGNISNNFGNLAFSAPESFTGEKLTIHSDIYSLGKLLEFIGEFVYPTLSQNIMHIIHKSIETDPVNRYETVDELYSEINNEFLKLSQPHLCKKIAVIGSHHGCGTSHIAISIVSTLNSIGLSSYYKENSHSDSLLEYANNTNRFKQHNGIYSCHNFKGIPEYGPGIRIDVPDNAIIVYDLGCCCNSKLLHNFDIVLLVCGGAFGHFKNLDITFKQIDSNKRPYKIICNLSNKKQAHNFARFLNKRIISFPFEPDPMHLSKSSQKLLISMLKEKGWLQFFSERKSQKTFFQKP